MNDMWVSMNIILIFIPVDVPISPSKFLNIDNTFENMYILEEEVETAVQSIQEYN